MVDNIDIRLLFLFLVGAIINVAIGIHDLKSKYKKFTYLYFRAKYGLALGGIATIVLIALIVQKLCS